MRYLSKIIIVLLTLFPATGYSAELANEESLLRDFANGRPDPGWYSDYLPAAGLEFLYGDHQNIVTVDPTWGYEAGETHKWRMHLDNENGNPAPMASPLLVTTRPSGCVQTPWQDCFTVAGGNPAPVIYFPADGDGDGWLGGMQRATKGATDYLIFADAWLGVDSATNSMVGSANVYVLDLSMNLVQTFNIPAHVNALGDLGSDGVRIVRNTASGDDFLTVTFDKRISQTTMQHTVRNYDVVTGSLLSTKQFTNISQAIYQ